MWILKSKKVELTLVSVDSLWELVESGGHLESLKKNSLLTLDANIFWPSDEASEISLWLNVSSDSKVASILLEQWAFTSLWASLSSSWGNHHLFSCCFLHLHRMRVKSYALRYSRKKIKLIWMWIKNDKLLP